MHPDDLEFKHLSEQIDGLSGMIDYDYSDTDTKLAELRKLILELEDAKRIKRERNHAIRDSVAKLERERDVVKGKIEMRRAAERQAAELLERTRSLDELTADAKWRVGINGKRIMPHQLYASHFMATAKRVICADEMGLGKTVETIATLDMLQAKRVLIVCPGEVMSGFRQEIKQWAARPVVIIGRKPKADVFSILKMLKDSEAEAFTLLVNYEAWARNKKLLTTLESMQFDTIVCDEAHKIKETNTSAFKGVEQIVKSRNTCRDCGGWAYNGKCYGEMCVMPTPLPSVENLVLLTGTPILNRPTEIYSLLNLINEDLFYSKKYFLQLFCYQPDPYNDPNKWEFRKGGMEALADKIQGFYIRRTLKDTDIKLPPQDVRIHEIDMNPEEYPKQCEIYEQISKHAQVMIEDNPTMDMMSQLAILTRLRQAVVWPGGMKIKIPETWPDGSPVFDPITGEKVYKIEVVGDYFRESVKLDTTMELIREYVSEGKRVVLFSQFAEVIREIQQRCENENIRAAMYYGDTSDSERLEIKNDFNRDIIGDKPYKWDVVAAHYKTGGVGLNFTAATRMIITDEEWNPGMEDQAFKRIHRYGQTEETIVDVLRVTDSIDTWLANLIEEKRSLVSDFNDKNEIYKEMRMMLMKGRVGSVE